MTREVWWRFQGVEMDAARERGVGSYQAHHPSCLGEGDFFAQGGKSKTHTTTVCVEMYRDSGDLISLFVIPAENSERWFPVRYLSC